MIYGKRTETSICGSFVIPSEDGNYAVPPATVIETFWAYYHDLSGELVVDDSHMILKYKEVDPATFDIIPFTDGDRAKDVTADMVGRWVPTKFHPGFIGGRQ